MPSHARNCSSCGRRCYKVLYFAEEPDKPLCSFCLDQKRAIWKAKTEGEKRGYSLHYCHGCGKLVSRNIFYLNGNYCTECYVKKVQSDAVRNKLHNEALEHG